MEMTVQVTQEELDKMEEIRSKKPTAWDGKELDLLKVVKEANEIKQERGGEDKFASKKKKKNWLLWGCLLLGLAVLIIILVLMIQKNENGVKEESNEIALDSNNTSLVFSPMSSDIEGFKKVYEIACSYGMTDSFDDMVSYLSSSDENRRKFYDKLVSYGMPDSYDDFCATIGYPPNKQQLAEENLKSVYDKLIELGSSGSFDDFITFFEKSDDNRRRTYEKCKENGYTGTYGQFLGYTGHSIDWKKVLDDFIAIKKVHPNLTVNEWFERFPEFNDDENLLQAAFDYDATIKSGKYSDENELRSKFPEFWPNYEWNSKADQNIINLYDHLRDEQLFVGNLHDFRNSLMSESYRNTLYQFLSEKQVFDGSYSLFCEELGLSTYTPSISDHKRALYDILTLYNYDLGDYESFSQKMNDDTKRRIFYDAVSEEYDLGSWEDFSNKMGVTISINDYSSTSIQRKTFSSIQYGFTYQYDDKEYNSVDKINKNSHCVMKLQSPNDEIKSILVSVWENYEFSSAYDPDFIASCQSVDQGMGSVIKSATKTKVSGVNALKSELKISPMGKTYYAAIYRFIHNKRMYMLNIYIPIDEYHNDKAFGDKCANNFKFN